MYINDVHILYYVGVTILGVIVAWIVNLANDRLPQGKKLFSKEVWKKKNRKNLDYWLVLIIICAYLSLVYFFRNS